MFLAFRLVNQNDDDITRIMNRKGCNKGGKVCFLIVAANFDFFGRTSFAANHIAARLGVITGAVIMRDDQPHHRADSARRLFGKYPQPQGAIAGLAL